MKNKNLFIVWVIASMVALTPDPGLFGQATSDKIGGELTPDIAWHIDNGTLYITGTGVVPTTMFGQASAWYDYKSQFQAVVIADGITDVGRMVFNGYKNLTSVTIAGSVRDIAPNAFSSKKIAVVEVKGAIPPDISVGTFWGVKFKKAKLIVPTGTKATYQADPLWNKFATIEESAQSADTQPAPVETLTEPCKIYLERSSNFVGAARKVKVYLNGIEQGLLGNGKIVMMTTDCVNNVLYLQDAKIPVCTRRFDATAGGEVHIDFSHFNGYMKVTGGKE